MARPATRQTFVKGQTVYVHAYSTFWRRAKVINPDLITKAARYSAAPERELHNVKIIYFDHDTDKTAGAEWNVLNRRNKIIDQAAYDLIQRGKEIGRLQGDVRQHQAWEKTHAAYVEQANHLVALIKLLEPSSLRNTNVALYLRSVFTMRDARTRERHNTEDVTRQGRELADKAKAAEARMQALGVKEWS